MAYASGGRLAGRPVGGWTSHRKHAPFLFSTRIGTPPVMGQAQLTRIPDAVEAKSFVVRDANGQRRAVLGVDQDGLAGLLLMDKGGKVRGAFSIAADGRTVIEFLDQTSNERILFFLRPDGTPGWMMKDGAGNTRVVVAVPPSGQPVLGLSAGPANTVRFQVSADVDKVSMSLRDDRETQRFILGVDRTSSVAVMLDKDSNVIWKAP